MLDSGHVVGMYVMTVWGTDHCSICKIKPALRVFRVNIFTCITKCIP